MKLYCDNCEGAATNRDILGYSEPAKNIYFCKDCLLKHGLGKEQEEEIIKNEWLDIYRKETHIISVTFGTWREKPNIIIYVWTVWKEGKLLEFFLKGKIYKEFKIKKIEQAKLF